MNRQETQLNTGYSARMKASFGLFLGMITFVVISIIPMGVNAQTSDEEGVFGDRITLEQAFEMAMRQNHAIRIERLSAELARNNVTWGNAGRLPTIDIAGSAELSRNNTDLELANFGNPSAGNTRISVDGAESRLYQAGLNLSYTLFDGFSGRYRYRQLQQFDRVAQLATRVVVEQTLFDVAQSFLALLEAEEQLAIEQENLSVSQARVEFTRDAKAFGSARNLDVLNAEVNAGNDRIRVEQAQNRVNEARRNLLFLMGMDAHLSETFPKPTFDYTTAVGLEADPLLQAALTQNVRVELAESEVNVAELQQRLETTGRFPRISLQSRYGWLKQENDANQLLSLEQVGFTASVNLRYTLFDGFNTRRSIQNAAIQKRSREENRIQVLRRVETDVLNAWAGFETQTRALNIAEETVEVARLQFKQAQEANRLGQLSSIDLRDTQLSLLTARLQHTQLRNNLRLREIELLLLSGGMGY